MVRCEVLTSANMKTVIFWADTMQPGIEHTTQTGHHYFSPVFTYTLKEPAPSIFRVEEFTSQKTAVFQVLETHGS
jgi:hypothetical protein